MSERFASRLREALTRKGWSQVQLAKTIGVTPTAVSGWVNGSREPNLDRILQIADVLDVSVGFLVGRSITPTGTGVFDPNDPHWRDHPDCPALFKLLDEDEDFDKYLQDPKCRAMLTGIAFMRGTASKEFIRSFLDYVAFLDATEQECKGDREEV